MTPARMTSALIPEPPGAQVALSFGVAITCLLSNQTTMIPRITYTAVIVRNVIVTFGIEVTASLVRMR